MCGRYLITSLPEDLMDAFLAEGEAQFDRSYNVTPGSQMPIIKLDNETRQIALCRWGLKPHWAKPDNRFQAINARAETLSEKPSFRQAFKQRRCLIPVNGFYEWKREGKNKQPYYFTINNQSLFSFAGIWDRWEHEDQRLDSYAIVTTQANEQMQAVHHRMPVILPPEHYQDWLTEGPQHLLKPYEHQMDCYPVSSRVNSPQNNDADLTSAIPTQMQI